MASQAPTELSAP